MATTATRNLDDLTFLGQDLRWPVSTTIGYMNGHPSDAAIEPVGHISPSKSLSSGDLASARCRYPAAHMLAASSECDGLSPSQVAQSSSLGSLFLPYDHAISNVSSISGASAQSTESSADVSPRPFSNSAKPYFANWTSTSLATEIIPDIIQSDSPRLSFLSIENYDQQYPRADEFSDFVDPILIQHLNPTMTPDANTTTIAGKSLPTSTATDPQYGALSPPKLGIYSAGRPRTKVKKGGSGRRSPFLHERSGQPYPLAQEVRRCSITSSQSRQSVDCSLSHSLDIEKEGVHCPYTDCGKPFKDLKAHILTHQSERPEKCPIATCAYHAKGFARKYDKNRHTLTHYKGTMVCGFCPGSGSASEKSFNRADVFKRHLTSVHGVEQTPPNSRKKGANDSSKESIKDVAKGISGKCSTCSGTFRNAQDFYEHLDDCVLRIVQQEEPSEVINDTNLRAINNDENVRNTLGRHMLPTSIDSNYENTELSAEDDIDDCDAVFVDGKGEDSLFDTSSESGKTSKEIDGQTEADKSGRNTRERRLGFTVSKGGVPLLAKGRRRRKHYPNSWGCSAEQMKMKKRVFCVYDGPRRLWKDDMMLNNDFEVRTRIGIGDSYVTDLDVETLKRTEALHDATEEEKGPWMIEDEKLDIEALMA